MNAETRIKQAAETTEWNPFAPLSRMGVRSSHAYLAGLTSIGASVLSWLTSRGKNDSRAQSDR